MQRPISSRRIALAAGSWLIAVACVVISSQVVAEDGWSMPNLNPFASKSKSKSTKTPSRSISDSKSSGWSLNPFAKTTSSSRRNTKPSTLTKTWEAITPWEERKPTKSTSLTGSRGRTKGSSASKSSKDKGWLESWFGSEPPKKVETVGQFLDQDRPEFQP